MSLYSKIIDIQKLNAAWQHVRKNKPAAGVDGITWDMYEQTLKTELKQLHQELVEQRYEPLPVKRVVLYKEEKQREIALYSMRDKVIQTSIAVELNKRMDHLFGKSVCAYRPNSSALQTIDQIEKQFLGNPDSYLLKADIMHFFDNIRWENLEKVLQRYIPESDVIELIARNVQTGILGNDGEIIQKLVGIHQGSSLAPVLSNIYLMDFDKKIETKSRFYVRYSDDLLVFADDKQGIESILQKIILQFDEIGLKLNLNKTKIRAAAQGVDFLGYHFDAKGKSIPTKAEENLSERLETLWLSNADLTFDEKIHKAYEIVGGWKQYFREERSITSPIEFAVLVNAVGSRENMLDSLKKARRRIQNIYRDIAVFLGDFWKEHEETELEMLEYEQFFYSELEQEIVPSECIPEILPYLRKVIVREEEECQTELMQVYSDFCLYKKAAFWMKRREQEQNQPNIGFHTEEKLPESNFKLIWDATTPQRILDLLVGREDLYCEEIIDYGDKRKMEKQMAPLSDAIIKLHLGGSKTLGTYIQRANNTVHSIVVDVDITRKILLIHSEESELFQTYLDMALDTSEKIVQLYRRWGIDGYIEYSGYRGFHVWLFLSEWVPVRYANLLCELIGTNLTIPDGIMLEYFPNTTRIKPGKYGQVIKLPYGIHSKSGRMSCFLSEDHNPMTDVNGFLDTVSKVSLAALKRIIAANTKTIEPVVKKEIELDLQQFKEEPESVMQIVEHCNLMKYLCKKATATQYLTHMERLSILYVFGHAGEEGKSFVHRIMSFTLNYQYSITEKFIRKLPEKPISCVKLREQYKQITAEFGCSCIFKKMKNCYPSPVLHSIVKATEVQSDITLPISRTVSKEKEKKIVSEVNVHQRALELAKQIQEIKKQKRDLDKNIIKYERELNDLFDSMKVDSLEIEIGLLVRRKKQEGVEWIIEL